MKKFFLLHLLLVASIHLPAEISDTVVCDSTVHMPAVFTIGPGEGGKIFQPVFSKRPEAFTFKIYGAAASRVFESTNPDWGWDGTANGIILEDGIFLWHLWYRFPGETRTYGCAGVVVCTGLENASQVRPYGYRYCTDTPMVAGVFRQGYATEHYLIPALPCVPVQYEFNVYNRDEKLVFTTDNYLKGWNGYEEENKPCPEGTYRWTLLCRYAIQDEPETYSGFVILMPQE
ncbi:MAG TPA: gliding motility-associated C-terminal domain-containing protein [Bacteroidia bacterium]|nr:gliding motility-associated C-terminal domain-containing protein [Bacteroidia bacterium]